MCFARDGSKKEIDLLIFENNTLYPLEIKTKPEPSMRDIRHFHMLDNIKGVTIGEGGVICMANNLLPLDDKNYIIPLSLI